MSDNDPSNNAPRLLKELKIPGRTGPVSSTPLIWGINLAAAKLNFPRQGLLCQAGPWGTMGIRDSLQILRDSDVQIGLEIVDKDEVDTELQMFVEAKHLPEGMHTISYAITPLGGTSEHSEVMQVLVKLTLPGGPDHSEETGHPGLVMHIPEEFRKDGVHQDNIGTGISITLGNADGSPPYLFATAGDKPQLSWGGVCFSGPALTQEQAEGKTPVIVTIPKETIVEAGDSGAAGLAVAFEVYDLVDNRSDGWSVEQRVVVTLDETRLGAPLLKEALNNVLDVDKLGDANGTVQVMAVNHSPLRPIDFEVGDTIFVRIKGTPKEGAPIDIKLPGEVLRGVPSVPEITVSNGVLCQLAQAQIALSYHLEKADGSAQRNAKTQFISAIGEIHRLAAPVAREAKQGAIDPQDPELKQVTIEIAFDPAFAVGQAIKLFWLGTRPDLSTYLPNLNLRPITQGDIDANKLPLQIIVDKQHLIPIIGGKLELYYHLLIEDSVLATMSTLNQTHAIRESIHADILQIGEPRQELPEPEVAGVVDGVLPADTNGTTLTVNYLKTFKDDIVTRCWEGSITGVDSDWVKLSSFTAGQPVPFPIKAELIKGNEGGTVKAYYQIKWAAGGTSYSDTLEFSVGVALDLKAPRIKEAPNDTSLNPLDTQTSLTALVDYVGMQVGDKITATWSAAAGTPAGGSHTTEPWTVTTIELQQIPLLQTVVAFNLGRPVTVSYSVTHGDSEPVPSPPRTLAVLLLPESALEKSWITEAPNNGEGPELDITALVNGASIRTNIWPLGAVGQPVGLELQGEKADGTPHNSVLLTIAKNTVHQAWLDQGYYTVTAPFSYLKDLAHGSELRVVFEASLDTVNPVTFPVRTYTVSVLPQVLLTFTNKPYTIAPAGRMKNIELLLSARDNSPIPKGKLSLKLPNGCMYADGGSGDRDFITDDVGRVSVAGVKGTVTPGTYSLGANSGDETADATLTVTELGPVGSIPVGVRPGGIDVSPDGTRAYVCNSGENTLSVIDTATHWLLTKIPVGKYPRNAAISPDGTRAYVCNWDENTLSVIDTATHRVLTSIPVGNYPADVAINPDGTRVYVSIHSSNTVSVIDTATDLVLTSVPVGSAPLGVAGSPNGTRAYVCNSAGNTVSVIDTATDLVLMSIPVGNYPFEVAISPDGTRAYVSNGIGNTLSVIDTAAGRVLMSIPVGTLPYGVAISPDGTRAYVSNVDSNTVSVIDTATNQVLTNIPVGSRPHGLAVSPDGNRIYVCNFYSNTVTVLGP
jgi:YVTN family beta-propeller protein